MLLTTIVPSLYVLCIPRTAQISKHDSKLRKYNLSVDSTFVHSKIVRMTPVGLQILFVGFAIVEKNELEKVAICEAL